MTPIGFSMATMGILQLYNFMKKSAASNLASLRSCPTNVPLLRGGWSFQPLNEQACKVILSLEFEFSSKLVEFAFGKVFTELTGVMVQAFTERAKLVYGAQHG